MIRVEGLSARIGSVGVLADVSLAVSPGELAAVIGANGAGKTTLLRTISNVVPRTAGRVLFDGRDTGATPAHLLARSGLVHVPQGRQIVPDLSVRDNLLLGAARLPDATPAEIDARLAAEFGRFPVLRDRQSIPGGSLSGGEQQMLAVSRALMMRPKALMLDEPSLGLAPLFAQAILRTLRALADAGVAVLLVEQMALAALRVADTACVLRNGRIALQGRAEALRSDRALVESYLG
jgi:branched-chain amino acid transport system ATP-binding protein